jgi:hypothetical protein
MEHWKLESQTYTMPRPIWTLASGRDTTKHHMKVTLEYDNSNQITFLPFESKLRAKLQTDRHIIGNKQEQVWYAFGYLKGKASMHIYPWIKTYQDDQITFIIEDLYK